MDRHETANARCGVTGFWMGPLSQKLVCGRENGHAGTHIALLPRVSVGFTDEREDGTIVLAGRGGEGGEQ